MKNLGIGLITILLGFLLVVAGFFSMLQPSSQSKMTDEQIVERALELGMIPLKEAITGELE